jgi:hypothetical protein
MPFLLILYGMVVFVFVVVAAGSPVALWSVMFVLCASLVLAVCLVGVVV